MDHTSRTTWSGPMTTWTFATAVVRSTGSAVCEWSLLLGWSHVSPMFVFVLIHPAFSPVAPTSAGFSRCQSRWPVRLFEAINASR